jgi:hypothetical protein
VAPGNSFEVAGPKLLLLNGDKTDVIQTWTEGQELTSNLHAHFAGYDVIRIPE